MVRLDLGEHLAKPSPLRFTQPRKRNEEVVVVLWSSMASHVEELDLRPHDAHPTRCCDNQILDRAAHTRITAKDPRAMFDVFEEHIEFDREILCLRLERGPSQHLAE